ncbi:homocysteine S-methyltransferase [Desulfobaculum xiamenense]|uniref:Homocysteine S-methyltransferase n=1 Tax=Desulfobaculum xiamenense TaxID=995050 RepID=A0A846QGM0_9BACT|nr:bifunctional homocysteine S-methyltransferase/methylenetetrahydrofolate reductase [Desulfobaculum xiamenense]NJB67381.1 homocysteine S-methyltransferase [Desulfobaculum xiamenense]
MRHNLIDELSRRVVLADGAMGSRIFEKGVPAEACYDELNLTRPDLVAEIHAEYITAGAELIETNTFGANALKLERFGLAAQTRLINRRGAEIARRCARDIAWVGGSMGPLGRLDELPDASRIAAIYAEQAEALAEGGVDVLFLETFSRLEMLLPAVTAVKQTTNLPVVAQMVFTGQGGSFTGVSPSECLQALADAGADVVGINCGAGPLGVLEALRKAGSPGRPLSVFPNSGYPERSGDRLLYGSAPDYFADAVMRCVKLGARLVGGCCGTTPQHIAALRRRLDLHTGSTAHTETIQNITGGDGSTPELPPTRFSLNLGQRKMVLVELDPPKHLDATQALDAADALADAGVDAITIAENPLAVPRLSNTALAGMIRRRTGAEVIVHLTGRDRNLIGMQSTLMGLAVEGLQNVLAVTGDPPPSGTDDVIKGVFDLRSFDLISLLRRFNEGVNHHGDSMRLRTNFCTGAAFNPNTKNHALQVRRMERKIECGARYFLTQPVYTREAIDEVLDLTAHIDVPIFIGIMPLVSSRNAEFLHNEFPGISIPDDTRRRMREAGDRGVEVGTQIAWELLEYAWPHFAGVYIMPPFNRYGIALDLMQRLRAGGLLES